MPVTNIRGQQILNGTVQYVDIQQVSASRLVGNPTGSAATMSEISLGTGLSFSSGSVVLSANLQSLSGLSYSSASFVKMTAAGTFALDTNTYITGSAASGQIAYWNGAGSVTGSATLTYTPTSSLLVNNSVTAAAAIARGISFTPTLVAAANNDVLVGLDIAPTHTNGAFTGVTNYDIRTASNIRVGGNISIARINPTISSGNGSFTFNDNSGGSGNRAWKLNANTNILSFFSAGGSLNAKIGNEDALGTFGLMVNSSTETIRLHNSRNVTIQDGGTFSDFGQRLQVTGTSYFTDSIGVGTTSFAQYGIRLAKSITGAVDAFGITSEGVIQSNVTATGVYFLSAAQTQATSFTLTNLRHFYAFQGTFGAGSTVTNQIGFLAESNLVGATNNIGFYGNIPSGTGRWNLYMNGTADNYMAGSLGIGSLTLSNYSLVVGKSITGSIVSVGIGATGPVASDVTNTAYYYFSSAGTQAATFSTNIWHFGATQGTFGANSTVVNQYGFRVASSLVGATNNFGFYGDIPSGTGRYNLYMGGTADNYLAGKLSIGANTATSSATTGALVVTGGIGVGGSVYIGTNLTTGGLTMGQGITNQDVYLNIQNPGIGYGNGFNFVRGTDGAGIRVIETGSDNTMYEMWMSDNPDGGDMMQWRWDDWQNINGLMVPIQSTGKSNRYVADTHSILGSITQATGTFYTTSNFGGTNGSDKQLLFNIVGKLRNVGSTIDITAFNVAGYTGTSAQLFWIKLDSTTTFSWGYGSTAGTATATGIALSTSEITLANGIKVTFSATTGTVGDTFAGRIFRPPANTFGPTTVTGAFTATSIVKSGGTSSQFLKADGSVDSSVYITGNQSISVTGDATGSGTTAIALTLATVNSNIGTFNNVTVNAKGLVTAASNVAYSTSGHTHDDRYLPFSANTETSNLAIGWYTIAINSGTRAIGKFILRDTSSGNHQSVAFYATHHFGNYSDITVLQNSRYSGDPFRHIRIKEGGTYDGALLQVYLDQADSTVKTWLLENIQNSGWSLVNWVADATDPGGLGNFAALTNVAAQIDLNQIQQGGIATTGPIFGGGDTTQYEYLNTNNYSSYSTFSGSVTSGGDFFLSGASKALVFNSSVNFNTQIYETSGSLVLRTGGTDRLTITSAGAATFSSSVAIQSLYADLQNTTYVRFSNTGGATRWGYIQHDGTNIAFSNDISGGTFTFNKAATFSSSVTASSLIKSGGTSAQFLMADGSVSTNPGWITSFSETDTLASVTGRGSTTTIAIGAPNFYDGTGGYNVNLGSNGIEGRGLVAGYSGGSYGGIGFNVRHTTTGGSWIAPSADTSSYILFTGGGFHFYGAAAGTAGRTLAYTTLGTFSSAGLFNAVNITVNGSQVWHAGNLTNLNQLTNGPGYVTGGPYLPLAGGTMTGSITFSNASGIFLQRSAGAATGINFYDASYRSWTIYMSSAGVTTAGPTGNITAPSGTYVTSWALRSFIENSTGYGWTWESGTGPTGQPSLVAAELRASDGLFRVAGSIYSGSNLVWHAGNLTNLNQLTNGPGYTTNTGTVTSVLGTGAVSGLTLTGTVTSSGSLTLGGTLTLTSGDVTTALGYTPYNATNPNGYITSSSLGAYLPLAGGTMTGNINWGQTDRGLTWGMNTDGAYIKFFNTGDGDADSRLEYNTSDNGDEYHRFLIAGIERFTIKNDAARFNNNVVWHAGNDGSSSGLDADLLDGLHATGFGRAYSSGYSFHGTNDPISTATFISILTSVGAFSQPYWTARGSWCYACNGYINDTGLGDIHLAGCTVEVMGDTTNFTIRIHTPTTSNNGVVNREYIYVQNSSGYSPGWRILLNNVNYTDFAVPTSGYAFGTTFSLGTMYVSTGEQFTPSYLLGVFSNGYAYKFPLAGIQSWIGLSNYLPLTGGTLTGELIIKTDTNTGLQIKSTTGTQSLWVRTGYDSDGSPTPVVSANNVVFQSSGNSGGTFSFVSGNTKALSIGGVVNSLVALQQNGNQVWHAGNDGSGSGLDADTVDGYHASVANNANYVVVRDGSGDIFFRYSFSSYVNTTDDVSTSSITNIIAKFGDNYHRSASAASVQTFLGLGSMAYASTGSYLPLTGGTLTGGLTVATTNPAIILKDTDNSGTGVGQIGYISFQDSGNTERAWIGYGSSGSNNFTIANGKGDVVLSASTGVAYVGANIILHSGNYNSYSPTLTGGSASGTWGINVTGNAATANRLTSVSISNVNTGRTAGYLEYYDVNGATGQPESGWNSYISVRHGNPENQYGFQFASPFGTDTLYWRGWDGSNPLGWRTVWHSGNLNVANWFGAVTTGGTTDWNHVTNTRPGTGYTLLLGTHSNGPGPSDYFHSLNLEYSSKDGSGNVTQMAVSYGSPGNKLYMRGRYDGTWSSWNQFVTNSGTWDISITGNAATATNADTVDGYHEYSFLRYNGYTTSNNFQTFQSVAGRIRFDQVGALDNGNWTNQPTGVYTYGGVVSFRGDNFGLQIYGSHTGDLVYKTQWQDDQYSGWRAILHSSNYNSYAPTLTGTGASGTWSINVTGTAASETLATVTGRGASTTTDIYLNNASPTLYFQDTNHRSAMIHVNSNVFYVLRGTGTNSTGWTPHNSYWPLELNLENNNATFGGSITAVGDVTAYSDVRLKENVVTIENALEKVIGLRGVTYNRKDNSDSKRHLGVIAQEVEEVLPEVVNEDQKGIKNVAYGNMVGVLIEAIKEQQTQIEDLKKQIEYLAENR